MPRGGLRKLIAALKEEVPPALYQAGDIIAAKAAHSITSGSGSFGRHVPSRPGEPPNNDTGVLVGGIEVTQPSPLRVEVTSTAPYSAHLEFGTSRMAERPFMRPATALARKDVSKTITAAVNRAVRKSKGA